LSVKNQSVHKTIVGCWKAPVQSHSTEESAENRLLPQLVESEIEFKDVDSRLAEQAYLTRSSVLLDELAEALWAEVAGFGDAGNLKVRGVGGNVGIEP
jgi:hypothetical protein